MINAILGFLVKYLWEVVLVYCVGMFTAALKRQFGEDRAKRIEEIIVSAMMWAEQEFGIGTGQTKFEKAYQKIIEMLQAEGIKLTPAEEKNIKVMMESKVPEINSTVYSAMPKKVIEKRDIKEPDYKELVKKLRKKYPELQE